MPQPTSVTNWEPTCNEEDTITGTPAAMYSRTLVGKASTTFGEGRKMASPNSEVPVSSATSGRDRTPTYSMPGPDGAVLSEYGPAMTTL